ncbi:hypothetical protein niasHS_006061 [Heterodera schachtii]|uniref:Uncharacterized protein n=1 Tax=Heterodera schachtii TaxID=97005 RepID=A0ABD2JVW1_HETSC
MPCKKKKHCSSTEQQAPVAPRLPRLAADYFQMAARFVPAVRLRPLFEAIQRNAIGANANFWLLFVVIALVMLILISGNRAEQLDNELSSHIDAKLGTDELEDKLGTVELDNEFSTHIDAKLGTDELEDKLGTVELDNEFSTHIDAKLDTDELEDKLGTNIDGKLGTNELEDKLGTNIDGKLGTDELEDKLGTNIDGKLGTDELEHKLGTDIKKEEAGQSSKEASSADNE